MARGEFFCGLQPQRIFWSNVKWPTAGPKLWATRTWLWLTADAETAIGRTQFFFLKKPFHPYVVKVDEENFFFF